MKTLYWTSLGLGWMFVCVAVAAAAEPIELFNGKDLSGWTKRGGAATYAIEDGAIVGRSVPDTSNTFLATDKEYGDFELELDFKIDDPTFNSGVQIRSHARPEGDGERVFGYQVEIDPRPERAWSAGLYFEGGSEHREAGWLDDLADNEAARNAFKLGEWNHLKVVADGRRIQTWLNDVTAADFTDSVEKAFTPRGFIALQVHEVGEAQEPREVRWRNIKLSELTDSTADAVTPGPAESGLRLFGRALGAMFGIDGGQSEESEEFLHLLGQPAPKFELESVAGDKVRLEDLRGQVVLLDFWATWCGPCMRAMPEVEKVHAEFAGQPVTVIGVNQQDDRDAIQESIKQVGTTFTHVMDTDGSVGDSFGASAIPHTVLVDQQGVIQAIHQGYSAEMRKELTDSIQKLLRGEKLYDEQKVAEARAKREQQRAEIAAKVGVAHADRLESLGEVLAGAEISSSTCYNPAQWVALPGESEQALVLLSGQRKLVIVRPGVEQAEAIDVELPENIGVWDYCPVRSGDEIRWAMVGAEYDDDYNVKQFTLFSVGGDGKPVWSQVYAALDEDSTPSVDIVSGDLTGDTADEIAMLVEHDGLDESGNSGPDGATRVLTIYDASGATVLRSWMPGKGDAAVFILPEADGNKLLMATSNGITRFRVKPDQP